MADRLCIDCGTPVSRCSTGRCRPCSTYRLNTDPAIAAHRKAQLAAYAATPEGKAKMRAGMARYVANMPEAHREQRRANGRHLARTALNSPEARAKNLSPEKRAEAGRKRSETVLAWCPPEWRAKYKDLTNRGRKAADAKRIVLDLIAGKPEPAKYVQQKSKLAWCPEHRLEEYRRVQKAFGAAEARRIIEADMSPFDRQLARVRAGAKLVEVRPMRRADPAFTLGGIAPEAM